MRNPEKQEGSRYLAELRQYWRPLLAASAGMGAGFLLNHYVANLFAPHLIAEFGWSRSDFALIGTLGLVTMLIIPFVGRMTDLIGVRLVAAVGVAAFPLTFIAFSLMNGSIVVFAAITALQTFLAGANTSSTVYSRLVAVRFQAARGLALAVAATSPALVGMIGSPLINAVIETSGWRIGYMVVAAYTATMGIAALILIPKSDAGPPKSGEAGKVKRSAREDYPKIFRASAFWVIAGGFLLCNLIYPLQSSQMKLMLLESGASSQAASWMISLFAAGVMIGRFACGLALDRFPAHLVAAIALGLPALGLLTLGLGFQATGILAASVMIMGLSLGAESDLAAYLVIRYFRMEVYGTVLGLVVMSLALSAVLGALLLSVTLQIADHFRLYMLVSAVMCTAGAFLFLLLGRNGIAQSGLHESRSES
jgi:MFS family permease